VILGGNCVSIIFVNVVAAAAVDVPFLLPRSCRSISSVIIGVRNLLRMFL
jgi:uncharacterized membrane protein